MPVGFFSGTCGENDRGRQLRWLLRLLAAMLPAVGPNNTLGLGLGYHGERRVRVIHRATTNPLRSLQSLTLGPSSI
jgi:hypothetical protein